MPIEFLVSESLEELDYGNGDADTGEDYAN